MLPALEGIGVFGVNTELVLRCFVALLQVQMPESK